MRYAQAALKWERPADQIVPVRCVHLNCAAALRRGGCERRNYNSESEVVEIASSEPVVSGAPRAKVAATLIVAGIRSEAVRRAGAGRLVELKAKASGRP